MRLFEWFSPTVHVVADGHFHGLALRGKRLFSHISLVVNVGIIIITVILFTRILLGKIFRQLPSSKVIIIARRVWMIPLTTPTLLQRRRLGSLLAFAWLGLILFPCPSLDTISRSTSAYFYGDASRAAVFRAQPSVPATLNKRSRLWKQWLRLQCWRNNHLFMTYFLCQGTMNSCVQMAAAATRCSNVKM